MTDNIWKAIPTWEGCYEASITGIIRSLPRRVIQGNRWGTTMFSSRKGIVLSQSPNSHGYLTVTLRDSDHYRKLVVAVHYLIAVTFLGPRPEGLLILHNNDDKTDNRVSNLRYGTPSDNVLDALRHGTWRAGARHYKYRPDIDETEILKLRAKGWTYERLATHFGIGEGTVGRIIAGTRLRPSRLDA